MLRAAVRAAERGKTVVVVAHSDVMMREIQHMLIGMASDDTRKRLEIAHVDRLNVYRGRSLDEVQVDHAVYEHASRNALSDLDRLIERATHQSGTATEDT